MTELTKDQAREWVAALRSGRFLQGRGRLRMPNGKHYCCLGVLCEISGVDLDEVRLRPSVSAGGAPMPLPLAEWGGDEDQFTPEELRDLLPDEKFRVKLATQNDNGGTFEEIARLIEVAFEL